MQSADLEVLQAAQGWLAQGRRVTLATVVHTFGSAPRPEGSLLALSDDGLLSGSVSGGCIEADLLERVRTDFPDRPTVVTYGVETGNARRFGLPCGGMLQLVLEPLASPSTLAARPHRPGRAALPAPQSGPGNRPGGIRSGRIPGPLQFDGPLSRMHGPRWRLLA